AANAAARCPGTGSHSSTKLGRSMREPRRNSRWNSPRSRRRSGRRSVARAAAAVTGGVLDRQPPAALRAPALEDLPASLRRHPLAEPMRLLPPPPIGLVRTLHATLLLTTWSLSKVPPSYRSVSDQVKGRPRTHASVHDGPRGCSTRGGVLWLAARKSGSLSALFAS